MLTDSSRHEYGKNGAGSRPVISSGCGDIGDHRKPALLAEQTKRRRNVRPTTAMSIKQLPEDVAAQIKSSVAITSLNHVVCGFVKNSLDAGASRVNISVDYRRGNCSVEDDGHGIPPSDFQQGGGLGKLYCE